VQVAGNTKMRTVRLGFVETSTWVLVFANPRVGEWVDLPKWEHRGVGGWEYKNEDSKAWICRNEHLGARFRKSESWRMGGPAKMGISAGNTKTRTVRLRFGEWVDLPKWEHWGAGGCECKNGDSKVRKSETWGMGGPAKMRPSKV